MNQQDEKQPPQALQVEPFSPEELKVLRECNSESFFQRSLPIGGTLGTLMYLGVKQGYFKPHWKYGAIPKVIGVSILGYFIGKFSYVTKCEEKLMKLPNSRVAELLLQRHSRNRRGELSELTFDTDLDEDIQSFRNDSLHTDQFVSAFPDFSSSEHTSEPEMPEPKLYRESFDELRRRNREEYERRQRDLLTPLPASGERERQKDPLAALPQSDGGKRNKYGDLTTEI